MPRLSPAHAPFLASAALKYAAELQAKGWIAKDTAALGTAVGKLKDVGTEHENASDERLGLTDEKIIKANDLYHDCLVIQNAARLEYPGGKDAAGNARNITGRARFLLDAFPPRALKNKEGGHSCPPSSPSAPRFPKPPAAPSGRRIFSSATHKSTLSFHSAALCPQPCTGRVPTLGRKPTTDEQDERR